MYLKCKLLYTPREWCVYIVLFLLSTPLLTAQEIRSCNNFAWVNKSLKLDTLLQNYHLEEGEELAQDIIAYAEANGLQECLFYLKALWNLGEYYEFLQIPDQAAFLYHKIIPLAQENGYHDLLTDTYISLERTHESSGRGEDAARYLRLAKELIETHNLENKKPRWYMRSSSFVRIYEDDIDKAKEYALKAIRLGKKYEHIRSQTDGYMLMGMMESDDNERISYWLNGRDIFLENRQFHGACTLNNSVAGVYLGKKEPEKSLEYVNNSRNYIEELKSNGGNNGFQYFLSNRSTHGLLQSIYSLLNQKDSVQHHLERKLYYDKKMQRSIDHALINDSELRFALRENELKNELYIKQRYFSRLLFIAAVIISLVFLGSYLSISRNKRKIEEKNAKILAQNESLNSLNRKVNLLISEIHHRLKNNLQTIVSLLLLEADKMDDKDGKQALESISYKVNSIAELHRELYREDDLENIKIKDYLSSIVTKQLNLANLGTENVEIKISDQLVTIEKAFPLGIITSELISNSLKHAQVDTKNLNIYLSLEKTSDWLYTYKDNGKGYDFSGKDKGYGSLIFQAMCKQLGGNMEQINDHGAKFTMRFNALKEVEI